IAAIAASRRLPMISGFREVTEAGGLMSYGPNVRDVFRRAPLFVDKILKGTKPGDMPVERPTHFCDDHQPQDRQSARPHDSAGAAAAGGPGDRVIIGTTD